MKKFLCLLTTSFALLLVSVIGRTADYTVTLTTYVPTASSADFTLGAYPNITSTVQVRGLFLANGGAAETVRLYDNCTSSTTAALAMTIIIPSSSTWPSGAGQQFPARLFILHNPCINKVSTANEVKATWIYDTSE